TELGIVHRTEILAERAIAIAADGRGEEQPILPPELFLTVHAERLVFEERSGGLALGRAGDIGRARDREDRAGRRDERELLVVVLRSGRGRRGQVRAELLVGGQAVVGREVGRPLFLLRRVSQTKVKEGQASAGGSVNRRRR